MLDQINDVGWGNNAKVSSVYYRYTILEKKKEIYESIYFKHFYNFKYYELYIIGNLISNLEIKEFFSIINFLFINEFCVSH